MKYSGKLVLESGEIINGNLIGSKQITSGEIVFSTSVVGYEESLTDPSYNQQILVMTFPIQGIYGISYKTQESSKIQVSGFIVQELEDDHYNWEAKNTLNNFLKDNNVSGLKDVDTRMLAKIIREKGCLKGKIVPQEYDNDLAIKEILATKINNHVEKVFPNKLINNSQKNTGLKIALINFGCKQNILNEFCKRNFNVTIYDKNFTYNDIKKYNYDAVFLSNGPGNPEELIPQINEIKKMIKDNVVFIAICLGHQLLGLALGLEIEKLKYGHHSINHPVICNLDNEYKDKVFMTTQNHNYAIKTSSLSNDVLPSFTSINDKSSEGLYSKKYKILSCQFHPESTPGPHDADFIFELFIRHIKENKNG